MFLSMLASGGNIDSVADLQKKIKQTTILTKKHFDKCIIGRVSARRRLCL
jgi:hypothetical protein